MGNEAACFWIGMIPGTVCGFMIGLCVGANTETAHMQHQAIRYGHATIDRESGTFRWNGEKTKRDGCDVESRE